MMPRHVSTYLPSSETQSAFACRFRQGPYSTVIEIAAPVEYDIFDALLLRALGNELADGLGGRNTGAGLEPFQRCLFQRRRRCERGTAIISNDLRVNMFRRAKYAEPSAAMRRARERATHPPPPPFATIPEFGHSPPRYFFLPSLRKMRSSEYLMPLPLYASGGRYSRISAATWPTFWRSAPEITISTGRGVAIVMPSGIG